jgi:glycerol-3-phosphate acyltransferase PlsX
MKGLGALDSSIYGGAPLLGVRGVSIICHGNSSPRAIKNAIGAAVRAVESRMNDRIGEKLAEVETSVMEQREVS